MQVNLYQPASVIGVVIQKRWRIENLLIDTDHNTAKGCIYINHGFSCLNRANRIVLFNLVPFIRQLDTGNRPQLFLGKVSNSYYGTVTLNSYPNMLFGILQFFGKVHMRYSNTILSRNDVSILPSIKSLFAMIRL